MSAGPLRSELPPPACSEGGPRRYPPAPLFVRTRPSIGPASRIALAAPLLAAGCCLAPAADARFHRFPAFETPTATFESLRAALRADDPAAEYRCFSSAFRAAYGLRGADAWRLARARILRERPEIRWIARARLGPEARSTPDRASAVATVLGRRIRLEFVREEFFEVWTADGRRVDASLDGPLATRLAKEGDVLRLELRDGRFRDLPPGAIERVLAGGEWKILDVGPADAPAKSP